jgi:hypothetical protein
MSSTLPIPARIASGLLACLTLACGASQSWSAVPRPVTGLPDRFVVDGTAPAGIGRTCLVHLKAPDGGARLTLVRSSDEGSDRLIGDYRVEPAGRYGLDANELLRVDCGTGRASGAVRERG